MMDDKAELCATHGGVGLSPRSGEVEESRKFSCGYGTRFIVISFRSVFSDPCERNRIGDIG